MKISVSPAELKSQAKVYNDACALLDEARNNIDSMNSQMAEQWQGQAFNAYLDQYAEVCRHFDNYRGLCVDIYNQLLAYANHAEETDAANSTMFGLG